MEHAEQLQIWLATFTIIVFVAIGIGIWIGNSLQKEKARRGISEPKSKSNRPSKDDQ